MFDIFSDFTACFGLTKLLLGTFIIKYTEGFMYNTINCMSQQGLILFRKYFTFKNASNVFN